MKMIKNFAISSLLFGVFTTQSFGVTEQQIDQFKSLPKAQQEALAQQYGIDAGKTDSSGTTAESILDNPPVVTHRNVNDVVVTNVNQGMESEESNKSDGEAKVNGKTIKPLKPFGYQLFAGAPTTFAPATDIPVPHDYVLGPGDSIKVQLFGKSYNKYTITIDRNGTFIMPQTGPLQAVGMSFENFKTFLNKQIEQKVIGATTNITMGELRSIRVFVLGEAFKPGAYTVSSLSTITHALFVSGGISEIGSLRNIQLKRKGDVVATLDLYDLLLRGDMSNDVNLLPGDVVFIPPIGGTVGIDGEVKRPAIYELRDTTSAKELVELAGGFSPTSYPRASKLERLTGDGARTVLDIDLSNSQSSSLSVQSGDVLRVYSVLDELENTVELFGHVFRPGNFSYKTDMVLGDILQSISQLKPSPDLEYGLVISEMPNQRTVTVKQFAPRSVFNGEGKSKELRLNPRDKIYVFSSEGAREIPWLLDRLRGQSRHKQPPEIVEIVGNVRFPGQYPLTNGMTIEDLIKASFDLSPETDMKYGLLKRKNYNKNISEFEVIELANSKDLQKQLTTEDKLYVFSIEGERYTLFEDLINEIKAQANKENQHLLVQVVGEVRFPGVYPLSKDMTLEELVAAAGGYTESSYLKDATISRFKSNLIDESRYEQIKVEMDDEAIGFFKLQPRDVLTVKRIPDWKETETVTLRGEFKFPGIYVINKGETLAELIERAGGFSERAFISGSMFFRNSLKEKEQIILDETEAKLRRQVITGQINSEVQDSEALISLLDKLEQVEASGRMIITTNQMIDVDNSIELNNGDVIAIPKLNPAVSIIGEVYSPTSVAHRNDWELDDYLEAAGGYNQIAEVSDTYVIKANGNVVISSSWFGSLNEIEPGDTIVVPTDIDPFSTLTLWKEVTSIVYQSMVAIAAVAAL